MTSYLDPVPNIPTLSPTNFYPASQQKIEEQLAIVYTDISNVVNDKKRADKYLLIEDITNDVWVDGNPIFRKTIAISAIPAGAATNYPHGITSLATLVNIRVMVSDGTTQKLLGYANPTAANACAIDVNATDIIVTAGAAFGANFAGYAIMEYTKQ